MFSTKFLKLAVGRSLGKPTENQGELFEELYNEYMADSNSSSLREQITAAVAGCKTIPGKLGRDAIDINGIEKEIKPKNYTGKRTNGSGCFNDYTRNRYERDLSVNLPIISSLFAEGMLIYVVEFKFDSISNRLNDQIVRICEEQGNRYVRSCSWTYAHWIDDPDLIVHYINKDLLKEHYQYGEGVVVSPLYKKLICL
tara:strand:+ start:4353 stop:4946 length:594 start_codon:yes stop_codon:yes gene_type:complete